MLSVLTVAVRVTLAPEPMLVGLLETETVVGAAVTVKGNAADALDMYPASPPYDATKLCAPTERAGTRLIPGSRSRNPSLFSAQQPAPPNAALLSVTETLPVAVSSPDAAPMTSTRKRSGKPYAVELTV